MKKSVVASRAVKAEKGRDKALTDVSIKW